MKLNHKIKFVIWSLVAAFAMTNDRLRSEYSDYREQTWSHGLVAFDSKEWLHRRWFPHKYDYEGKIGRPEKRVRRD